MYRLNPLWAFVLTGLLAGIFATTLVAQESLEVQQQNDISYVSGGVGDAEQQALQAMSDQFDLKLTFATEDGKYLSDVQVQIKNAQDVTVLDALSKGPLFFADLAPGTYTVNVSGFGQQFESAAEITDGSQTQLVFRWP